MADKPSKGPRKKKRGGGNKIIRTLSNTWNYSRLLQELKVCSNQYTSDLRKALVKLWKKRKHSIVLTAVDKARELYPQQERIYVSLESAERIFEKLKLIQPGLNKIKKQKGQSEEVLNKAVTSILEQNGFSPEQFRNALTLVKLTNPAIIEDLLSSADQSALNYLQKQPDFQNESGVDEDKKKEPQIRIENILLRAYELFKSPSSKNLFSDFYKNESSNEIAKQFYESVKERNPQDSYEEQRTGIKAVIEKNYNSVIKKFPNLNDSQKTAGLKKISVNIADLLKYNILKRKDFFKSFIILDELYNWLKQDNTQQSFNKHPQYAAYYKKFHQRFTSELGSLNSSFAFEKKAVEFLVSEMTESLSPASALKQAKVSINRETRNFKFFADKENPFAKDLRKRISALFILLKKYYSGSELPDESAASQVKPDSQGIDAKAHNGSLGSIPGSADEQFVENQTADFSLFQQKKIKQSENFNSLLNKIEAIEDNTEKEKQIVDAINWDLGEDDINQLMKLADKIPLFRKNKQIVSYGELIRQLLNGPLKNKSPLDQINILNKIIADFEVNNRPPLIIEKLKNFRHSLEEEPKILKQLMTDLKENTTMEDSIKYLVNALSDDYLSEKAPNLLLRLYGMVSSLKSSNPNFIGKMIEEIKKLPEWKQELVFEYLGDLKEKFQGNRSVLKGIKRINKEMLKVRNKREAEREQKSKDTELEEKAAMHEMDNFLSGFSLKNMEGLGEGDSDFSFENFDDVDTDFSGDLDSMKADLEENQQNTEVPSAESFVPEPGQKKSNNLYDLDRVVNSSFNDRMKILELLAEKETGSNVYKDILEVSKRIFYEIDPLKNIEDKIAILKQWQAEDYNEQEHIIDFIDKQLNLFQNDNDAEGVLSVLYRQLSNLQSKNDQLEFLNSKLSDPEYSKFTEVIGRLINDINKEPVLVTKKTVDTFLSDLDAENINQLKIKKDGLLRFLSRTDEDDVLQHVQQKEVILENGIQKLKEEEEESTLKYLAVQSKAEQEKGSGFTAFTDIEEMLKYVLEKFNSPGARQKFILEQELFYTEEGNPPPSEDFPGALKLSRYLLSPMSEDGKIRVRSLINRQDSKYLDFGEKSKLFKILAQHTGIQTFFNIEQESIPYFAVHLSLVHPQNKSRNTAQKILFLKQTLPGKEDFLSAFSITEDTIKEVITELEAVNKKKEKKTTAEITSPSSSTSKGQIISDDIPGDFDLPEVEALPEAEDNLPGTADELSEIVETRKDHPKRKKIPAREFYEKFKDAVDNDVQTKLKKQVTAERIQEIKEKAHGLYEKHQKEVNLVLSGLLSEIVDSPIETAANVFSESLLPSFREKEKNEIDEQGKQNLTDLVSKLDNINRYIITPSLTNKFQEIEVQKLCKTFSINGENMKLLEGIMEKFKTFWENQIEAASERYSSAQFAQQSVDTVPSVESADDINNPPSLESLESAAEPGTLNENQEGDDSFHVDPGVERALSGLNDFIKLHKVIIDNAEDKTKYRDDMDLRVETINYLYRKKKIFTYDQGKTFISEGKLANYFQKHKNDRLLTGLEKRTFVRQLKTFLNGFGSDDDTDNVKRKADFIGIDSSDINFGHQYKAFINGLSSWDLGSTRSGGGGGSTGKAKETAADSSGNNSGNAVSGSREFSGKSSTERTGSSSSSTASRKSSPKQAPSVSSSRRRASVSPSKSRSPASGQKGKSKSAASPRITSIQQQMKKHINKRSKKVSSILMNMITNMRTLEDLENMNSLYLGQATAQKGKRLLGKNERNKNVLNLISKFNVFNNDILSGIAEDDVLLAYEGFYDKKHVIAAYKKKLKELK